MQFSVKSVLFALAIFLPIASAATLQERQVPECRALLASCSVDSDCCGDLCTLGVSHDFPLRVLAVCSFA